MGGQEDGGTETLPFAESFGSATINCSPVVRGTCEKGFGMHSTTQTYFFVIRQKIKKYNENQADLK